MTNPSLDFQAGFNSANTQPFDETQSEEWKKGWKKNKDMAQMASGQDSKPTPNEEGLNNGN